MKFNVIAAVSTINHKYFDAINIVSSLDYISSESSHIIGVERSDCKLPRHLSSLAFLIDEGRSFVEFVVTLAAHVKTHGSTTRYKWTLPSAI